MGEITQEDIAGIIKSHAKKWVSLVSDDDAMYILHDEEIESAAIEILSKINGIEFSLIDLFHQSIAAAPQITQEDRQ